MDLQRLVDKRIAELQSRSVEAKGDHEPEDPVASVGVIGPSSPLAEEDFRDRRVRSTDKPIIRTERFDPDNSIANFCEIVDAALVEVAGRVMEIAERITEDHSRLEKDLLDLRLETLESVESVMDMALGIRKKARKLIEDTNDSSIAAPKLIRREFAVEYEQIDATPSDDDRGRGGIGARASMHDVGVAALFKKTH
jgi:hypothetical protein